MKLPSGNLRKLYPDRLLPGYCFIIVPFIAVLWGRIVLKRFSLCASALMLLAFGNILFQISLTDFYTRTIPERYNLAIIGLAVCAAIFPGHFPLFQCGIGMRLAGALAMGVPLLAVAVFTDGGIGGGDIKLVFTAGLLLGLKKMLFAGLVSCISGGLVCLMLVMGGNRKRTVAYGPYLCLGLILSCFVGV